jgi:hypothetical protein
MAKPQIAFRVPPDIKEQFDEYADSRGLNKSDAGRRLLERGLQAEDDSSETGAVDKIAAQQSAAFTSLRVSVYLLAIGGLSTLLADTFLGGLFTSVAALSVLLFAVSISATLFRLARTFALFREEGHSTATVFKIGATGLYQELTGAGGNADSHAE